MADDDGESFCNRYWNVPCNTPGCNRAFCVRKNLHVIPFLITHGHPIYLPPLIPRTGTVEFTCPVGPEPCTTPGCRDLYCVLKRQRAQAPAPHPPPVLPTEPLIEYLDPPFAPAQVSDSTPPTGPLTEYLEPPFDPALHPPLSDPFTSRGMSPIGPARRSETSVPRFDPLGHDLQLLEDMTRDLQLLEDMTPPDTHQGEAQEG